MQRPEKGNLSCSGCGPRLAGASAGDLKMGTIQAGFSSWPDIVRDLSITSCCWPEKAKLATERDGKSSPERTLGRT